MSIARFTLAYWCVLLAALMPLVCTAVAKWGTFRTPRKAGGYDNHDPRAWLAQQTGVRARANAAQSNCFEAMPFFIGAVLIAHQLQASQTMVDLLAFFFILLRTVYVMLYLADMPYLRSMVWFFAFFVNVVILLVGYR